MPLDLKLAVPDGPRGYVLGKITLPRGLELRSDDAERTRGSGVRLLEDGSRLGPAHASHAEIRSQGQGRFSHWGGGLFFSASDNSDPRKNGRAYAIAWDEPRDPAIAWLMLLAGASLVISASSAWTAALGSLARRVRSPGAGGREALMAAAPQLALFAAVAAGAVALGMERSAAILVTQPFEVTQSAHTVLGSAWIRDGSILPQPSRDSLLQLEFLAGAEIAPDSRFRHPLYALLALLFAPVAGVVRAMVAINILAWAGAAWACHRFARAFTGDPLAANWAALLAVAGMGFAAHALDPGPRLLSFALFMAGVAVIFESQAWRGRAGLGAHLRIGALLALACLQDDLGLVLVAGYLVSTIRHNARFAVPATLVALAMQPAWAAIAGEIHRSRTGTAPWILDGTAMELGRAWTQWRLASLGDYAWPLFAFESPWVITLGALGLAAAFSRSEQRGKAWFALAFIAVTVAAALLVAPITGTRAPLVYGIAIFFFAGMGAILARLVRWREAVFAPLAVFVVVLGAAWSTAHLGGVHGPAKAYFHGYERAKALFAIVPAQAQSLSNTEPAPRLLGGTTSLTKAGLVGVPAQAAGGAETRVGSSWAAVGLLAVVAAILAAIVAGVGWPAGALAAAVLAGHAVLSVRASETHVPLQAVEAVHRLERGKTAVYKVALGGDFRKAMLQGFERGAFAVICPGFVASGPPPVVDVDGRSIRVADPLGPNNWLLDTSDLLHALRLMKSGVMTVRFTGGDDVSIAGWQAIGLPGRQFSIDGKPPAVSVLPAVEVRLLRDREPRRPELVAF